LVVEVKPRWVFFAFLPTRSLAWLHEFVRVPRRRRGSGLLAELGRRGPAKVASGFGRGKAWAGQMVVAGLAHFPPPSDYQPWWALAQREEEIKVGGGGMRLAPLFPSRDCRRALHGGWSRPGSLWGAGPGGRGMRWQEGVWRARARSVGLVDWGGASSLTNWPTFAGRDQRGSAGLVPARRWY